LHAAAVTVEAGHEAGAHGFGGAAQRLRIHRQQQGDADAGAVRSPRCAGSGRSGRRAGVLVRDRGIAAVELDRRGLDGIAGSACGARGAASGAR
jgi:hypothetical protein